MFKFHVDNSRLLDDALTVFIFVVLGNQIKSYLFVFSVGLMHCMWLYCVNMKSRWGKDGSNSFMKKSDF